MQNESSINRTHERHVHKEAKTQGLAVTTTVFFAGRLHYGPGPLDPQHKRWVITAVYQLASDEVDSEIQLYEPVEAFDAVRIVDKKDWWKRIMRSAYINGFEATRGRVQTGALTAFIETERPIWERNVEEQQWAMTAEVQEAYGRWNIQVLPTK